MPEKNDNDYELGDVEEFKPKKTQAPPREIEGNDGDNRHKTLEEMESEDSDLSDFQSTLKVLFPKFSNEVLNKVAQAVMVARISPDIFLNLLYLTVVSIIESHDLDKSVDVQEVINLVYCAMSIGLDGKGRVDIFELSGAQKESEELDKLSRSMGI